MPELNLQVVMVLKIFLASIHVHFRAGFKLLNFLQFFLLRVWAVIQTKVVSVQHCGSD